jgi:hypothetical protein
VFRSLLLGLGPWRLPVLVLWQQQAWRRRALQLEPQLARLSLAVQG